MKYRCKATSLEGFVQILASNYLPHGYWFYVTGRVPAGKDPQAVDRKIIKKYQIDLSRQQRCRRKKAGQANLHYVRFEDFFVVLATHGKHSFFTCEAKGVRDIRKYPLLVHGYSLGVKRGQFKKKGAGDDEAPRDTRHRVRVQIARTRYRELAAYFVELAAHRGAEHLRWQFWNVPFEPYAPIRKQLLRILWSVNTVRSAMGYEKVPTDVIRYRRKIVCPFDEVQEEAKAA